MFKFNLSKAWNGVRLWRQIRALSYLLACILVVSWQFTRSNEQKNGDYCLRQNRGTWNIFAHNSISGHLSPSCLIVHRQVAPTRYGILADIAAFPRRKIYHWNNRQYYWFQKLKKLGFGNSWHDFPLSNIKKLNYFLWKQIKPNVIKKLLTEKVEFLPAR